MIVTYYDERTVKPICDYGKVLNIEINEKREIVEIVRINVMEYCVVYVKDIYRPKNIQHLYDLYFKYPADYLYYNMLDLIGLDTDLKYRLRHNHSPYRMADHYVAIVDVMYFKMFILGQLPQYTNIVEYLKQIFYNTIPIEIEIRETEEISIYEEHITKMCSYYMDSIKHHDIYDIPNIYKIVNDQGIYINPITTYFPLMVLTKFIYITRFHSILSHECRQNIKNLRVRCMVNFTFYIKFVCSIANYN